MRGLLPSRPARWTLLAAGATAAGVVSVWQPTFLILVAGTALASVLQRQWTLLVTGLVFVVLGAASGAIATSRADATIAAEVPERRAVVVLRLVEDASSNRYGISVGVPSSIDGDPWPGPRLAVVGLGDVEVASTVQALGRIRPGVRRVRDEIVAGTFSVIRVESVESTRNPLILVGNTIRRRVQTVFDGSSSADGLLAGFLIGDTRRLSAHDVENLRRSGLAHFVAVSGSNVAVFMLGWWIVTAPLSVRPRIRALIGAVGLGVFIVVTRWEPSVVRASAMTAVPLAGAMLGVPVDPWMALGTAVTVLLLVSADLLLSVGFQLSVAATAGVLVGVALARDRRPRWLWTSLLVTVSAQLAVAPIVISVFGTMPLFAPLANLVVAPIVTLATVAGGLSLVVGVFEPVATVAASAVLRIADSAASGPQLGGPAILGVVTVGVFVATRSTRPLGIAAAILVAAVAVGGPDAWPATPTVTALDIGQGDAILIQDPTGRTMLIDGGPDPGLIDRALRRQGVSRIDVVVATHGDADHVAGLIDVVGAYDVGELWVSAFAGPSDLLRGVIDAAARASVPIREVQAGRRISIGSIDIEVVSPMRRYASDNDGSIAILATSQRSVLIPGDIEAIAQADLPELNPNVLVIPHHGSASSDVGWITRTVGQVAILSYGTNTFGHPSPQIMLALQDANVEVRETFTEGDVSVSLSRVG
ncbi:MAG: ComEC/Rec2 family competence protein [Acidimicrobiia bacterium]